jgi:hypothetical protein
LIAVYDYSTGASGILFAKIAEIDPDIEQRIDFAMRSTMDSTYYH